MGKIILTLLFLVVGAISSEYVVVCNLSSGLDKLSKEQIRDLYMKRLHFVNDVKVIPVNSSASLDMRASFEKDVLEINRERLNRYWIKQHFQGVQPPVIQASPKAIKLFVKSVQGAVGYIPKEMQDDDLKVLYEF